MAFDVVFSAEPQLELTFLTSYEKIGAVHIYLGLPDMQPPKNAGEVMKGALAEYWINALLKDTRYSVPTTWKWTIRGGHGALPLPRNLRAGKYRIMLVLDTSGGAYRKFKLLGITSC